MEVVLLFSFENVQDAMARAAMRERIEKALRPSGMKRRPAQKSKVRQRTSARMSQVAEGGQTDRDRQAKAVPAPRRLSPPAKRPYCSPTQGARLDGLMGGRFGLATEHHASRQDLCRGLGRALRQVAQEACRGA